MIEPDVIAQRYLALWNEEEDARRRALLEQNWATDACYTDPMMAAQGRDDIATMIEGARRQFPGHRFTLRGSPDGQGVFVRFSWTLAPDGGAAVGGGTDVVRLDETGRIAEVVGFLDKDAA